LYFKAFKLKHFLFLAEYMKKLIYLILPILFFGCTSKHNPEKNNEVNSNESLQKEILQGWNTWNNPNLLSFVLMPDGLSIRITFRKKRGGPYWMDQSYITGPQINFPEKITPLAHAYDGSYISMEVTWSGIRARVQAAHDDKDIVILYTPLEVPEDPPYLVMESGILWNKPADLEWEGNIIESELEDRDILIRTTGKSVEEKFPLPSPHYILESDQPVSFYTGDQKTDKDILDIIARQESNFKHSLSKYGALTEAYTAMQAVISWNVVYDAKNDRAIAPVSRVWNETWGGYIIFDWDTYFTALMLALDQKELAYSNAIAITRAITEDGFIPNLESSFGNKSFDRSQPPVGSMCCKLIYERYRQRWFLEEVYDELLTWNRWWEKARDNEGYLSWGSDPHPRGMDGHSKQGAKWESGLDNSPLFDDAVFNPEKNVLELADVGLMGLYIADCNYLAEIAVILDKMEDASELQSRAIKYGLKLQELWDDESGIYRDKYTNTGQFSGHLAPTNFYPLLSGIPTQEQAERMIKEHFMNPEEFYGEWMIPSIARNDAGYPDNSYWRGRIWAPMNFLVYMGLLNYDLPEARKILVDKSLKLIMKEWTENRRVYENYNAETGEGPDVRNANDFYAWGGLLSFIALMEEGFFMNNE
jgi:putative isomerase